MTSTISPSTAAALSAKSSCSGFPAAAKRNMATTIPPAITISPADIGRLTVPIRAIAATVAMHGGNTFQMNIFSTEKTAFDKVKDKATDLSHKAADKAVELKDQAAQKIDDMKKGEPAKQ